MGEVALPRRGDSYLGVLCRTEKQKKYQAQGGILAGLSEMLEVVKVQEECVPARVTYCRKLSGRIRKTRGIPTISERTSLH